MNTRHDVGVANQIGKYGDAVEVPPGSRWLITSGTPGIGLGGEVPSGIEAQTELAWTHIEVMLKSSGMSVHDIVKVTQYLICAEDIPAYARVRNGFLGDARPASMLSVVPALVRPNFLVEVEVIAAAK